MSESFETERGTWEPDPIFGPVLDSARLERTVRPRDIAAAGGLTEAEVAELVTAFGLPAPQPDDPFFTPQEADAIVALARLRDVWPREVYLQAARVYGHALSEIAENEVHLFRYDVERKILEEAGNSEHAIPRVREALEQLLPLADPMLVAVHRRWVEHQLAQAAVNEAELRSPGLPLPGAQEVSFLFCDLKDFTAYADTRGDAAAIDAIERFSQIVHEQQAGGRIVKGIGDAYMLVFGRPEAAVAAGARIVERARDVGPPFVHASVHHGVAIYRDGDYFGRAVNLAARLLAVSDGNELVATQDVVEATGGAHTWTPRGAVTVRGMSEPVEVFTLDGRPG
ncbi:MAG TPA: adenylate/guanylate cyclase domain-containing protein [Thermoleophilaceae bacterium]